MDLIINIFTWMNVRNVWRRWKKAKRDLGMLPPEELTAEERIRGKFVEGTKHLKRRKESGRKPLTTVTLLIALAIAIYIMRYLLTGELTF